MNKFVGNGGSLKLNGVKVAGLRAWSRSVSPSSMSGWHEVLINADVLLDADAAPVLNLGQQIDITLSAGGDATWELNYPKAKIHTIDDSASLSSPSAMQIQARAFSQNAYQTT